MPLNNKNAIVYGGGGAIGDVEKVKAPGHKVYQF